MRATQDEEGEEASEKEKKKKKVQKEERKMGVNVSAVDHHITFSRL